MRKKSFLVALSVVFGLLMNPILVHAEFYKWIDDKGDVHFTDEYSNIPEKYLPVAETQRSPKETSPRSVEEKPTPGLAAKVSEPAVQETPLVLSETFRGVIIKVDQVGRIIVVTGQAETMGFPIFGDTRIKSDSGKEVPFAEVTSGISVSVEYIRDGDNIHTSNITIHTMPSGFGKKQREKQKPPTK
jgi:hypothetical protein